jgi:hypothetical protein
VTPLLTATAVTLTLTTAYVHLTLGSLLFTLNAAGYLGFAILMIVVATVPHPTVARLGWLAEVGLAGYAVVTIASYLVIGPYFALGWIAKGVEIALIGVVAANLVGAYGNVRDAVRAATKSLPTARSTS